MKGTILISIALRMNAIASVQVVDGIITGITIILLQDCNNRYSTYKHSGNQFHGQKRKGYKRMHRQANISMYIDINFFLEDPWEDLVKKFNSKEISKSETSKNEPLCSLKLADNDLVKKLE